MKNILTTCLFLILLQAKVDYDVIQFFSAQGRYYSASLDITDDSQIVVYATNQPEVFVYSKFGKNYAIHQRIHEKDAKISIRVDLSGDGEWLVSSDKDGIIFIYKKIDNKYERSQILFNKTEKYEVAKISDDYWIACSKKN